MQVLAVVVALFSLVALAASVAGGAPLPVYVPLSGIGLAAIVYFAQRISTFIQVFVAMYALGYLLLAGGALAAALGILPQGLAELLPPPFSASAAVVFAGLIYGASFLPVIRTITAIADPFFESREPASRAGGPFAWLGRTEGRIGRMLVALSIFITFAQVALQIRLNLWYRDLFNALEKKDAGTFWYQMLAVFVPLAAVWISIAIYDIYVDSALQIRWRTWLTRHLYTRWLDRGTHYRIPFTGESADNPDQRIQADVNIFIAQTMSLSIRLLSQAATLVSFMVILWGLSRDFIVPGTDSVIPGLLVWLVIGYAVVGTWLTHLIGRPLIALDFRQEKVEADFRFSLARLREYGEQIAFLRGERAEVARLGRSFGVIVDNFLRILSRRMKLTTFTGAYSQTSVVFPYILAAPSYFLGRITLGQFQQTASAFSRVESALSFFISAYTTLAAYKATTDRLTTFNLAMTKAEALGRGSTGIALAPAPGPDLAIERLALGLPDGRSIVEADHLTLRAGEGTLVTGPSGSGKSTLFRALAGIWPFGRGQIRVPDGRIMMVLPQRPYLPIGTLRAAVAYPGLEDQFADADIRDSLAAVRLPHLRDSLDVEDNWGQRLSGGEQQRLAIARALLAKPDWLFLDEATAALDEPTEEEIYRVLAERLPDTTIVSIGHRSTLQAFHDRRIDMRPSAEGLFTPVDARAPVPAQ
jgi:putative ATP-binding cassette transporter